MTDLIDYEAKYGEPAEVLADRALTYEDKIQILRNWRLDAVRRSESAIEGMAGGPDPRLRAVDRALTLLEELHKKV